MDKPTIQTALGRHILRAICRTEDTEEKDSSDKGAELLRSLHRGHHQLAMMADEASSEFRPKQPHFRIESRHTRVRDGILPEHHNKLVADGLFREALESQKTDSTPLLDLLNSDGLKYDDIFGRFFNVFVQGFVV
jgi:hypothetical protein